MSGSNGADRQDSDGQALARAKDALARLLELMGVDVGIEANETAEQLKLSISGPDASGLIGKKGKTLDALQYLVNKIVARNPQDSKLVVLDSDGYRERREASLVQLAERLAEKALDEGKIIRLNPMSARDRRVIHVTLRDVGGLSTRSEGDGDERRLLIVPDR
jgi:spoIIIJ-associated protein